MANETPLSYEQALAKLTRKQALFVQEYLLDLNATQAAIRAGYSKKSAKEIGHENLTKPNIEAAIQAGMNSRAERTEITADRVVEELAIVAFSNAADFFEWGPKGIKVKDMNTLTTEQRRVVAEVSETVTQFGGTVRVKLADKLKALEMIGRHLGMFTDNLALRDRVPHLLSDHPTTNEEWLEKFGEPKADVGAPGGSADRTH